MPNSNEIDLFNTNEHLDLLNVLKQNKTQNENEVVEELEKIIQQYSEESSIKKSIDSSKINEAFKSLNDNLAKVEDKLSHFKKVTNENSDDSQFININCPLGLNLTHTFNDVRHMTEHDVDKLLENFSEEKMKAMVS